MRWVPAPPHGAISSSSSEGFRWSEHPHCRGRKTGSERGSLRLALAQSSSLPGTPSAPELPPLQSLGIRALQLLANELRSAPLPRAPGVLPSWLSMWLADLMPTLLWVLPKGDSAETGLQTEALSVLPAPGSGRGAFSGPVDGEGCPEPRMETAWALSSP